MLPTATTRCAGRRDLTAETEVCPVRATCERYIANRPDADEPVIAEVRTWLCVSEAFEQRIPAVL
ncbi:MAG: hypothetical protein ACTS8S_23885 [Giesbergeria sp.]